jgi:hypothetical protein
VEDLVAGGDKQGHGVLAGEDAEAEGVVALGALGGGLGLGRVEGREFGDGLAGAVEVVAGGLAGVGFGHPGGELAVGEVLVGEALGILAVGLEELCGEPAALCGSGPVEGDLVEEENLGVEGVDGGGDGLEAGFGLGGGLEEVRSADVLDVPGCDFEGVVGAGWALGNAGGEEEGGEEQEQAGGVGEGVHGGMKDGVAL